MADLTTVTVIDEQMPPHAMFATVTEDEVRVTVSPRVSPAVLAVLGPEIAITVAGAVDHDREQGSGGES